MKRKQIVVLGLVLVIISVGILQYNYNISGEAGLYYNNGLGLALGGEEQLEDIPGAAIYVNESENQIVDDILAQQEISGFFAEAKIDRNRARSKQKEELTTLAKSFDGKTVAASANNTASLEAQEQLVALIRRSEAESTIETLVKQRGFEDVLAYMSDTDSVDVIVKASSLTAQDVAQISDIVMRHANITIDKITVKNVN